MYGNETIVSASKTSYYLSPWATWACWCLRSMFVCLFHFVSYFFMFVCLRIEFVYVRIRASVLAPCIYSIANFVGILTISCLLCVDSAAYQPFSFFTIAERCIPMIKISHAKLRVVSLVHSRHLNAQTQCAMQIAWMFIKWACTHTHQVHMNPTNGLKHTKQQLQPQQKQHKLKEDKK